MIVRMIVAKMPDPCVCPVAGGGPGTVGISPGAVVVAGAGVVVATGTVGISPASAETERRHVKATVNMNRFIGVTPCLRKNHVNLIASPKIRPIQQQFLQGRPERTNIHFAIRPTSLRKPLHSCEPRRSWIPRT
jgi:hypothetical protein